MPALSQWASEHRSTLRRPRTEAGIGHSTAVSNHLGMRWRTLVRPWVGVAAGVRRRGDAGAVYRVNAHGVEGSRGFSHREGTRGASPARMGRRTQQVNVRLTAAEKAALEIIARRKGFQGLSDYLRAAALEATN